MKMSTDIGIVFFFSHWNRSEVLLIKKGKKNSEEFGRKDFTNPKQPEWLLKIVWDEIKMKYIK
jgi:hypothetical protein